MGPFGRLLDPGKGILGESWGKPGGPREVLGSSWRGYWGPKRVLEKSFGCRGDFGGYWGPGVHLGAKEGDQMWVPLSPNVGPPCPPRAPSPQLKGSKVRSGGATSPAPPPFPSRDPQVGEGRSTDLSSVGGD